MSRKAKKSEQPRKATSPIRREIKGIIFLLLAVILGVSLFSHHPGDSVIGISTGRSGVVHNLFGTMGAQLSGWIFYILGFSSYWLVLFFLSMTAISFRGNRPLSPVKSTVAAILMIASFAGLLSLQFPALVRYRGNEIRSGGLVGYVLSDFMRGYLNTFGAYVLLLAVFVVALMYCTRLSFGQILTNISVSTAAMAKRLRESRLKKKEKKRKQQVREKAISREPKRPKTKVTIIEPKKEAPKKPEQEAFPFMNVEGEFRLPSLDLLNDPPPEAAESKIERESLEMNARRLERKLADFGVEGEVLEILPGPVITMFELKPAPGVKISKVAGLSDDLAMALRASSVRIVAPIPGKAAIGVEIANNRRAPVVLKDVLASDAFQNAGGRLNIALGKDITGEPFVADLAKMPHLLVAGATGTGKSVSLNAMINSLLFKVSPEMVRFLMIDPKRIELSIYKDIPHLLHPVVTEPKEATRALRWAVQEMERRYMLLSDRGVRNIETYNRKVLSGKIAAKNDETEETNRPLPYIILVIDELADLMMVSSRDVEEAITRLAQMARAAGIHLIIATQRPSVDVLTGIIKANFPTRISFQVSSRVDSRTILDSIGAENLLGEGDMLFMPPGVGKIKRIHGAFISEDEVKAVTAFLRSQMKPDFDPTIMDEVTREEVMTDGDIELDEKYDQAVEVVLQSGQASISMLQRKLRVGYNRAARMIEVMERDGIVGPSDGVKPREVFGRSGE